jgi:hypothetical protein
MSSEGDREESPYELFVAERLRERKAERLFIDGVAQENFDAVVMALATLRDSIHGSFGRALRVASRNRRHSQAFRLDMFNFLVRYGEELRTAAPHDFVLIDFLRAVLPRYTGPAIALFRGETFMNRKHRSYGFSWSANEKIARDYAQRENWRASQGGSVLLKTKAPARAVICAPALLNNRYGEEEYFVDRRRLTKVVVLERFSQLSLRDFKAPPTVD